MSGAETQLPRYNLSASVAGLPPEERYDEYRKWTRLLEDARSALLDLQFADDYIKLFASYAEPIGDETRITDRTVEERIAGSLFQSALIMYCRAATDNRSPTERRGSHNFSNGWSVEQKAAHARLIEVRNRAVAHYGRFADHMDGPWAASALVLTVHADHQMIDLWWARSNYKGTTVSELRELIPLAIKAVWAMAEMRAERMSAEAARLFDNDPDFGHYILQNPFDPQALAGDAFPGAWTEARHGTGVARPDRPPFG